MFSPSIPSGDRPPLRVWFCDFWPGFEPEDSLFWRILSQKYALTLSERPEILFYSCFGRRHQEFACLRIFYTGENLRPDMTACDFAISFDYHDSPWHYRQPLYTLFGDVRELSAGRTRGQAKQLLAGKSKFCNVVVSNPNCAVRNRVADLLSAYKPVDSGGGYRNTIGGPIPSGTAHKIAFARDYKFTMAFENSSHPGYTTEKILEAYLAGSVPLYWGSPRIGEEFDPGSLLSLHDYATEEDFVDAVAEADQDDERYLDLLCAPALAPHVNAERLAGAGLSEWLTDVAARRTQIQPLACSI
ncbi:glycosyltransferase family 10 domain-containing protein [Alienimonas chondri]|uniref:Alpha-(1,3)-fucosyltransferase FucT n=1 Tax=Alienimonas chondri TaxID=2681879 RepID=A0ABX1VDZ8_9PLAN|nr:glycosyltransferase family 10 [Alienimonas chondri]NNJ26201.1 Alpha-(1,3)-fucosyltransferase FucT [Alienimonas chondri]